MSPLFPLSAPGGHNVGLKESAMRNGPCPASMPSCPTTEAKSPLSGHSNRPLTSGDSDAGSTRSSYAPDFAGRIFWSKASKAPAVWRSVSPPMVWAPGKRKMMWGSSVSGFVPQPSLRATRLLAWAVAILLWSAQTFAAPARPCSRRANRSRIRSRSLPGSTTDRLQCDCLQPRRAPVRLRFVR